MFSARRFSTILVIASVFVVACYGQAPSYTCAKFKFFGPTGNSLLVGNGVNDSDEVVGTYQVYQNVYGFSYPVGGPLTQYLIPGSTGTMLSGINNAGEMVGSYTHISQYETLGYGFSSILGEPLVNIIHPDSTATFATGINNKDVIVGYYYPTTGGGPNTGFILSDNKFTDLSVTGQPADTATYPLAINDSGVVVGTYTFFNPQAFIYDNGTYTFVSGPPGAGEITFSGINNQNEIVGDYLNTNVNPPVWQGFVYTGGNYNTVQVPNATNVQTYGINGNGDITGAVSLSNGTSQGFLGTGCYFD
jgi:hypothetical protein